MSSQTFTEEQKQHIQSLVQQWLKYDKFENTRKEIQELLAKEDYKELKVRLEPRIDFGTAGLRARMAAGFACMNELIIVQTTQGLLKYIEEQDKDSKEKGIVIGYDGRHNSRKFAELTAVVFLARGFKVYLYPKMVPTPFVPFAVRQLKTAGGIMVTASHNPKQDNGYKLYWNNGCQIISPHDTEITKHIFQNLEIWNDVDITCASLHSNNAVKENEAALATVVETYYQLIHDKYCWQGVEHNQKNATTKITYTAMHGVGAPWTARAFKTFGLPDFLPVKQQIEADPEFPTVAYPNPEEGKGALKLAMELADKEGSRLIIANDPDADRLAVAEKLANGEWRVFNGNEIAVLLAYWTWINYLKQNPNCDRSKCVMISSTVSSKILRAMGEKEGFTWEDTLTGFKWIGNKADDFLRAGFQFLFGFEVEIGFAVGDISLDKDGVRTAAIFAEMANYVYNNYPGKTLIDYIDSEIYQKYGYYLMKTRYFFTTNVAIIPKCVDNIRQMHEGGYPVSCGPNGKYKIKYIRDLTVGYDNSKPNNMPVLPVSPAAQMVTFTFEDGSTCTLRNSGTEPKLKWYVEVHDTDKQIATQKLEELTSAIINEFIQPQKWGLIPPKDD